MRPSSSPSDPAAAGGPGGAGPAGLFDGVFGAGGAAGAVTGGAWLRAMLDAETALARANAAAGRIAPETAEAVARACAAARPDPTALGAAAVASGNPVMPLVRDLRTAVGAATGADAAGAVHAGATSQDILDTAAALVARRALAVTLTDLTAAARSAAGLARAHRDTPVAGRTLLQQAVPTTFGLVAAGWLTALDGAAGQLARARDSLAVQLGGAAGTLAALGDPPVALRVVAGYAEELGLAEPVLPWHTDRGRLAELAGALGRAAGALGKIARDVALYAQTEVGELAEAGDSGRGGSSAMPHKRNPVSAISAVACAARAPGLVATLLAAMPQEHQRGAGGWHAEWLPLSDLLATTGAAAHWVADCLGRLRVDAGRMRANLDATGGAVLAERVAGKLREKGEPAADELVHAAVTTGGALADALLAEPRVARRLDRAEIEALLDPAGYTGAAGALVDRALAAHAGSRGVPAPVAVHSAVDGPDAAPPLLMINSLGSALAMWQPQVAALAGRFRLIRFDLRGHGRSPVPDPPYDLADLGADALALLDRLGVDRASVCGASLGGMVGLWLAAHAPDRVDRLVVCGSSARLGPPSMWAARARTVRESGTSAVADAAVARWLTPGHAARDPALADRLRAMIAATPAAGYAACCGVLERAILLDDLPAIAAPTLVVVGADDPATPPSHAERVVAGIPGARLAVVPDAAHLANLGQPEHVNRLILDHLSDRRPEEAS
jgi:3-carboxy-cis,cis-muconate cycloisomerase/3-oxoadipate enol-lactonase